MSALDNLMLDVVRVREDFPILERRVHGDVPLIYLDRWRRVESEDREYQCHGSERLLSTG